MHYALCIWRSHWRSLFREQQVQLYTDSYIRVYIHTCLHNPYLKIYELINIYKVVPVFSCTPPAPIICHFTPFCEQPEQLNRDSIYICVYTHSLFIPFRRFYIFKNNKILFTCSVVHSPHPETAVSPVLWQLFHSDRVFLYTYMYTQVSVYSLSTNK